MGNIGIVIIMICIYISMIPIAVIIDGLMDEVDGKMLNHH